jgi:hypothetical protein
MSEFRSGPALALIFAALLVIALLASWLVAVRGLSNGVGRSGYVGFGSEADIQIGDQNVRFGALCGLKSEVAPRPISAISRHPGIRGESQVQSGVACCNLPRT